MIDPLLVDTEEHASLLLGNEAIVRGALEAGVGFACGYPGTPSSEVTDSFARIAASRSIQFEYSVNEKIAVEMAFAASLAGTRSICAMKHLGLMYAGDPISTIPYVGVVGGMVIVSAGDPSCYTSPNEQDQRHLGPMLHIPTLDPSTPQEAHRMTRLAFELSERSSLPVLLRITTRVAHARALVQFGQLQEARVEGFSRDAARFNPIPANARKLRVEIPRRLETARQVMADAGLFGRSGAGRQAILATGAPAATCADLVEEYELEGQVILATVGGVHPLPEPELLSLLADVDRVLVVEELSPFLEDAVSALCSRHDLRTEILGKGSGHLPEPFEYEPSIIRGALHSALELCPAPTPPASLEPVVSRPPALCPACPHRFTYFAARCAFGDEQLMFNDIGCYTLGYGEPLNSSDALLCMGAGFTLAAGVSRVTGDRTVGFLGDSTFFHSGMPALLNAIKEDVNMVAVILDNQVTAMTGFQESPTVEEVPGGPPTRRVSIEGVVRALGATQVETILPSDMGGAIAAFERARDAKGVSVIVAEEPCPLYVKHSAGSEGAEVYEIDPDRCSNCGREESGLRCSQGVTPGLERHMARGRSLELIGSIGAEPTASTCVSVAPCSTACPLALCVQGYAGHIASGQYREAVELIMSRCPLPDSVCRVCHRPCETVCVRNGSGGAVAINALKRFAMDWASTQESQLYEPTRDDPNGMSVAVVGAGPAGLAAAHDLRLRGYDVTLFDAADQPGGLLRTGIPAFRLPREAVQRDVDRILALGVTFIGNTALGRDLQLGELLDGAHAAVFLALGAHQPFGLEIECAPGASPPTVVDALTYLNEALTGNTPATGRRVVVVGGGNAAIDAARTARRLGAQEVRLVYRRQRDAMPALTHEVDEAEREGVELHLQMQPVRLDEGGIVCLRTEPGAPDDSGRRRPVTVPETESHFPADLVIVAVGQKPASEFLTTGAPALERRADGRLEVNTETLRTSDPRVFAGGDLVPGERTVTDAIATGQRAAWGIDRELRGPETADRRTPPHRTEQERPVERKEPRLAPSTRPDVMRRKSCLSMNGSLVSKKPSRV